MSNSDLSEHFTSAEAFRPLRKKIISVLKAVGSKELGEEGKILMALSQVEDSEEGFLRSLKTHIVPFNSAKVDRCVRRLIEKL